MTSSQLETLMQEKGRYVAQLLIQWPDRISCFNELQSRHLVACDIL